MGVMKGTSQPDIGHIGWPSLKERESGTSCHFMVCLGDELYPPVAPGLEAKLMMLGDALFP